MRRERLYLADMLEACDDVAEFVRGIDFEEFTRNKLVRSAVLQKLTVIGEAAATEEVPALRQQLVTIVKQQERHPD